MTECSIYWNQNWFTQKSRIWSLWHLRVWLRDKNLASELHRLTTKSLKHNPQGTEARRESVVILTRKVWTALVNLQTLWFYWCIACSTGATQRALIDFRKIRETAVFTVAADSVLYLKGCFKRRVRERGEFVVLVHVNKMSGLEQRRFISSALTRGPTGWSLPWNPGLPWPSFMHIITVWIKI